MSNATMPLASMNEPARYYLSGLAIASSFPLANAVQAPDDLDVDAEIVLGEVPQRLENGVKDLGPLIQIKEREALFNVPGYARFWVRDGRSIIVAPEAGADPMEIQVFLLGSVFGALCHQRGLVTLHASAVRLPDGGAALFAGPSGIGKSTVAAALMQRGYDVICDDLSVLHKQPDGVFHVSPGIPRLRLWEDVVTFMGIDRATLTQPRPALEKFNLPLLGSPRLASVPVRKIIQLRYESPTQPTGVQLVSRAFGVRRIMEEVYQKRQARFMGLRGGQFLECVALSRQVEVYEAMRRKDAKGIPVLIEQLEHVFGNGS